MKRITVVDSLRGFSLIGILLANLLIFQFGNYGANYPDFYNLDTASKVFLFIDLVFIHGSFMPIFVLLFGFGLVKMSDSLSNRGLPVKRALVRRGIMLFVFGLLHAAYLFSGDILYLYGTITILLFWLTKRSIRTMYISIFITIILFFSTLYINKDALLFIADMPISDSLTEAQSNYLHKEMVVNSSGSLSDRNDFFEFTEDPFIIMNDQILSLLLISILFYIPFFITGMIFAKNKFFESTSTQPKKILIYLTPLFLILKALIEFYPNNEIIGVFALAGTFGLSFSYIALFYYLYHHYPQARIFKGFESVGKLSLTNYIGQSIFHGFIYYSHGLGRFGDSNFVLSIFIALIFFLFQIIFSNLYLKYFKYGPLEYIIRVVTYWSFQPKRKLQN